MNKSNQDSNQDRCIPLRCFNHHANWRLKLTANLRPQPGKRVKAPVASTVTHCVVVLLRNTSCYRNQKKIPRTLELQKMSIKSFHIADNIVYKPNKIFLLTWFSVSHLLLKASSSFFILTNRVVFRANFKPVDLKLCAQKNVPKKRKVKFW